MESVDIFRRQSRHFVRPPFPPPGRKRLGVAGWKRKLFRKITLRRCRPWEANGSARACVGVDRRPESSDDVRLVPTGWWTPRTLTNRSVVRPSLQIRSSRRPSDGRCLAGGVSVFRFGAFSACEEYGSVICSRGVPLWCRRGGCRRRSVICECQCERTSRNEPGLVVRRGVVVTERLRHVLRRGSSQHGVHLFRGREGRVGAQQADREEPEGGRHPSGQGHKAPAAR